VNLLHISPATAGLLAQILPVFLLVFALEGGKLKDTTKSEFRQALAGMGRFFMVAILIIALALCVLLVQLDNAVISSIGADSYTAIGVVIWAAFVISLAYLYTVIQLAAARDFSKEALRSLNLLLDKAERKQTSKD
jgi:hypothetical protein